MNRHTALSSFLCDGISVSKGEELSPEKAEQLSGSLSLLRASGLLVTIGDDEPEAPAEVVEVPEEHPPVEEKPKKKKKG